MPTIRTRKTKGGEVRYEVQVRLKGADPEVATFRKLADAKRWAQEREVEVRERRHFGRALGINRTLADAIDRYTAEQIGGMAESERRNRSRALALWRDRLGHRSLSELSPDLFSRVLVELEAGGRQPGTVNRYAAAISRVLSVAEKEWGWIDRNPMRRVGRRREPTGRVRYLSDSERDRLLAECRASRTAELYPLVLLALATGARYSELVGLRWEDVSLERGFLTLHKTKNRERRSVPISGPAREAFALLGAKESGPIVNGKNYRTAWEAAVQRAGIVDFHWHDLRHSCASWLAMSGASLLEIAEILGHKSLSVTRRYAHLSKPHLAAVAERMAGKFLKPIGPSDPQASD